MRQHDQMIEWLDEAGFAVETHKTLTSAESKLGGIILARQPALSNSAAASTMTSPASNGPSVHDRLSVRWLGPFVEDEVADAEPASTPTAQPRGGRCTYGLGRCARDRVPWSGRPGARPAGVLQMAHRAQ